MPFDKRKAVFGVLIAGVAGGLLFLPAIYFIGLAVAPPLPVPATTRVPPTIAAAIWARANGGSATEFTPMSPVSLARFAACMAIEDFLDTTPGDARRVAECRGYLPALQGVEYLSGAHMRDANLQPSFREGLGRAATTAWITRSWTRDEFLNTLAGRAEFAHGWRGVEAASRGYFGRTAADVSLPQAALLAAFIGEHWQDPWCGPAGSAALRHRILSRMRDDGVITNDAFQSADASDLDIAPPPADHQPCRD